MGNAEIALPSAAEVTRRAEMDGGELVIRIRGTQPRDVTARRLYDPLTDSPLANDPVLRYVGPYTPAQHAWDRAWEARPLWQRLLGIPQRRPL